MQSISNSSVAMPIPEQFDRPVMDSWEISWDSGLALITIHQFLKKAANWFPGSPNDLEWQQRFSPGRVGK